MPYLFPHFRYLILFLFIGCIPFLAQDLKGQKNISKQCMQKMKLTSDKIVLPKNNFEMSFPSEIIIDPLHSTIITNLLKPNKQEKTVTNFIIKEIRCEMNEDITSGSIIYTVKSNNPYAAFPKNGFILKATKEGIFFFNSTDPADDTPIIPVLKFEIIQ